MLELTGTDGRGRGECLDHVDSGGEENRVAARAGSAPEGNRQMRFAESGGTAQEKHIGLLLDELEMEQVLDLGPVDFLRPAPLKLIQGFKQREASHPDASLETLVIPMGDLPHHEALEVLEVTPTLIGCGLRELEVVVADVGQLQPQQQLGERP